MKTKVTMEDIRRDAKDKADQVKQNIQQSAEQVKQNIQQSAEKVKQAHKEIVEGVASTQKSAVNIDDPIDTHIVEPIAWVLTKGFIKLGIIPNVITCMSGFFGMLGGAFFFFDNLWLNLLGVFFEFFAAVLDACDGQVARSTHHYSKVGRFLDGFCDGLGYLSIYVHLMMRLGHHTIPFTDILWGWWIWIPGLICGGVLHVSQARSADLFRNAHMYFCNNKRGNELTSSQSVRNTLKELKNPIEKFLTLSYLSYTVSQERQSPKLQKLLKKIKENGGVIPEQLSEYYAKKSDPVIRYANLLTYNVRTIALYLAVCLNQGWAIFPFILLVLEPISLWLRHYYEKLAKECYDRFEETI